MTANALPILYSFRRCPYAMRARLALAASQTSCELREVKLSAKPEGLLAASAKGTVPVLVLPHGEVVDQSLDIMRWALARNDPGRWLERDCPDLIAANDGIFKYHLDRYKYPERHATDPLEHRDKALSFLADLDRYLAGQRQNGRSEAGLAEYAIMPFVRQFAAVDEAWFKQALPGLHAWLHEHLASELFNAIMLRVPPWQPGDPQVIFPPALPR